MTQQYTPVTWQDETTSQQGTLINAERLNQMQTAHHYADGWEEVDAVPTADPSVAYHKVVYCTADSTFYRWDGTEWTADIDDETKALLQQEIARATEAESTLHQLLADEHDARVDAEAAINNRITDESTALGQRIATETSARYTADTALGQRIDTEATARESADLELGADIGAETARARQAEQTNAQAIANTYTKAETDTLLSAKADKATTLAGYGIADAYTKSETDTLLATKADQATTYTKSETDTAVQNALDNYATMVRTANNQTINGEKYHINGLLGQSKYIACPSTGTYSIEIKYKGQTTQMAKVDVYDYINNTYTKYLEFYMAWNGNSARVYGRYMGAVPADIKYTTDTDGNILLIIPAVNYHSYLANVTVARSWNLNQEVTVDLINAPDYSGLTLNAVPMMGVGTYATAPTRGYNAGAAYSSDIATIGTLDAYTPMVRTSGAQTIAGEKTHTSRIILKNNSIDHTTAPTEYVNCQDIFFADKNNITVGRVNWYRDTGGKDVLNLEMHASDYSIGWIHLEVTPTSKKLQTNLEKPTGW